MTATPDQAIYFQPMVPLPARVENVIRETADTVTLSMVAVDCESLPGFAPGQFSMLYGLAVGEIPVSISGDPADHGRLTYTVRSVGSVSRAITDLRAGDILGVRGPFGTNWPIDVAEGGDVLIVAGGIGLAPLRSVIYHVLRHRNLYGRLILLYGARSPKDQLFRNELISWRQESATQILDIMDSAPPGWNGRIGLVTNLIPLAALRPDKTTALICGPEVMMRFAIQELLRSNFAEDRIFLSMERNMKCGIGICGHCQMGPYFLCKDGPVFAYSKMREWMKRHEL